MGRAQSLSHERVVRRLVLRPAGAAGRGRHVLRVVVVLEHDRDAVEQAARAVVGGARGVALGRGGQRDGARRDDRVERLRRPGLHGAVVGGDAVEIRLRQLHRGHDAGVHRGLHLQRAGLDELERPVVVDDLLRHQGQVGHRERVVAVQVGGGDRGPARAAGDLAEIALELVQVVRADLPVAGDVSGRVLRRKVWAGPRRSGLRRRRGIPQRAPRRRWQVFPGSPGRGGDASLSFSSRTPDRDEATATRFPRRFSRVSSLFRAWPRPEPRPLSRSARWGSRVALRVP